MYIQKLALFSIVKRFGGVARGEEGNAGGGGGKVIDGLNR